MATAKIIVLNHGHSVATIDSDTPLAVQTATETANAAVTLTHISSTTAVAGQTQLVAQPGAGLQIVVSSFVIQNESAVATTMILQAGGANTWRALGQNQGDGLAGAFPVGREWALPANTALNLWLSGANSCGYSIAYYVK